VLYLFGRYHIEKYNAIKLIFLEVVNYFFIMLFLTAQKLVIRAKTCMFRTKNNLAVVMVRLDVYERTILEAFFLILEKSEILANKRLMLGL
jgi:hypothetical protein